jgi:DnaJ-class molecular chaperone
MEPKICPRCKGNGFFKVKESVNNQVDKVVQCPQCNSKGEVHDKEFDEYFDSHVELKPLLKH